MALYSFNLGVIFVSVQRDALDCVTEIEEDKNTVEVSSQRQQKGNETKRLNSVV